MYLLARGEKGGKYRGIQGYLQGYLAIFTDICTYLDEYSRINRYLQGYLSCTPFPFCKAIYNRHFVPLKNLHARTSLNKMPSPAARMILYRQASSEDRADLNNPIPPFRYTYIYTYTRTIIQIQIHIYLKFQVAPSKILVYPYMCE